MISMVTEKKETLRSLFREIYAPILMPLGFIYRGISYVKMNQEKGYLLGVQPDKYRGSRTPEYVMLEIYVDFNTLIFPQKGKEISRFYYGCLGTIHDYPLSFKPGVTEEERRWREYEKMPLRTRIESSARVFEREVVPLLKGVYDIDSVYLQRGRWYQQDKQLPTRPDALVWHHIYKKDFASALIDIENARKKRIAFLKKWESDLLTLSKFLKQEDYNRRVREAEIYFKELDDLKGQLQYADDAWAEKEIRKNIDENCKWLKLDFESKQKEA